MCTSSCHLQRAEVKPLISQQLCCQVTRQAIPFECATPPPPFHHLPNYPTIVRLLCNRQFISSRVGFELHDVELDNRFSQLSSHCPTGSLFHCANHYSCLSLSLTVCAALSSHSRCHLFENFRNCFYLN